MCGIYVNIWQILQNRHKITIQRSSKPTLGFICIYIQLQVALIFADDYTMAKSAFCPIIQLEKRVIELTMAQ
jgi:hypothetical protein